jgi:hypothetical protein
MVLVFFEAFSLLSSWITGTKQPTRRILRDARANHLVQETSIIRPKSAGAVPLNLRTRTIALARIYPFG